MVIHLDGVDVKVEKGYVELHIPTHFTGEKLKKWEFKNNIELTKLKNDARKKD